MGSGTATGILRAEAGTDGTIHGDKAKRRGGATSARTGVAAGLPSWRQAFPAALNEEAAASPESGEDGARVVLAAAVTEVAEMPLWCSESHHWIRYQRRRFISAEPIGNF